MRAVLCRCAKTFLIPPDKVLTALSSQVKRLTCTHNLSGAAYKYGTSQGPAQWGVCQFIKLISLVGNNDDDGTAVVSLVVQAVAGVESRVANLHLQVKATEDLVIGLVRWIFVQISEGRRQLEVKWVGLVEQRSWLESWCQSWLERCAYSNWFQGHWTPAFGLFCRPASSSSYSSHQISLLLKPPNSFSLLILIPGCLL